MISFLNADIFRVSDSCDLSVEWGRKCSVFGENVSGGEITG
jgi:hypothetical protein